MANNQQTLYNDQYDTERKMVQVQQNMHDKNIRSYGEVNCLLMI